LVLVFNLRDGKLIIEPSLLKVNTGRYEVEKILLKPIEAAQVLGIGRSLIYELIARREIPSVKLGRCLRVPTESLSQWLKAQESKRLAGN
jgi:excisionase family DNA binding protein